MKPHTEVWAKFESKGKPQLTAKHHGTIRDITLKFADWILRSYMGSHMVITIARREDELEVATRGQSAGADSDMQSMLEQILAQESLALDDPEPELFEGE